MPIWQMAVDIAETIFNLTEALPRKEDYGFTSQIRRSALSISANIAEAYGRNHALDNINFYYMARGSLTETQSHPEYGKRVGYFLADRADEIDETLNQIYNNVNKVVLSLNAGKKSKV